MRQFRPLLYVPVAMLVILTGLYTYSRVLVDHPHWDHSAITATWMGLSVGMALAVLFGLVRRRIAQSQRAPAVLGGISLVLINGFYVINSRHIVSGHELRLAITTALGIGAALLLGAFVRRWRIPGQ